MPRRLGSTAALAALVTLLAAACGSSSSDTGAPAASASDVVLAPTTRVLSAETLAMVEDWSADTGTLRLPSSAPGASDLAVGQVIVGGVASKTPFGLLRHVTAVVNDGGDLSLSTTQATLEDALSDAEMLSEFTLGKLNVTGAMPMQGGVTPMDDAKVNSGDGFVLGLNNVVLDDQDGDSKTTDDQVRVSGSVTLKPDVHFNLKIHHFSIQEITFELDAEAGLSFALHGAENTSFDKSIELASYTFTPIEIPVGVFPLVVIPKMTLSITATGKLTAKLDTSAAADAKATLKMGYTKSDGWGATPSATSTLTHQGAFGGTVSAKVKAGPELDLDLYGVAGVSLALDGFAAFDATYPGTPCWRAHAGVEADLGAHVAIFGISLLDYKADAFHTDDTIDEGACDPSAVGADVDAHDWSRSLSSGGVEQSESMIPLDDGGFLVASSYAASVDSSVVRLSADGSLVWQDTFESGRGSHAMAVGSDGRYLVAGTVGSVGTWLYKLDRNGALLWSLDYDPVISTISGITATSDGGFVVVGTRISTGSEFDAFTLKIDANGKPLWAYDYPQEEVETHEIRTVKDGTLVFAAASQENDIHGGEIVHLDGAGKPLWTRELVNGLTDVTSVDPLADGGFAIAGNVLDTNSFGAMVGKLDAKGNVVWMKSFHDGSNDMAGLSVRADASGALILAGRHEFSDAADAFALSATQSGSLTWATLYGGARKDQASVVIPVESGLVFAGLSYSIAGSSDHSDAWIWRTSSLGVSKFSAASLLTESHPTAKFDDVTEITSNAPTLLAVPVTFTSTASHPVVVFSTHMLTTATQ